MSTFLHSNVLHHMVTNVSIKQNHQSLVLFHLEYQDSLPAEHLALPILGLRHGGLSRAPPAGSPSPTTSSTNRSWGTSLQDKAQPGDVSRGMPRWQETSAIVTGCHNFDVIFHWNTILNNQGFEGETPLFRISSAPLGNQREAVVLQHCALCWLTSLPSHWRTHSITVPNPGLSLVNTASNNLGPAQQLGTVHFGYPRFRIPNPGWSFEDMRKQGMLCSCALVQLTSAPGPAFNEYWVTPLWDSNPRAIRFTPMKCSWFR